MTSRLALLAVLTLAVVTHADEPPAPTPAMRARAFFEEGNRLYNLGSFSQALAAFQDAYLARPDAAFLFNEGQCLRQLGSWKEEIFAYRRFLTARPDAPNRADVERYIRDAEAELARQKAAAEKAAAHPTAPADTLPVAELEPPPAPAAPTVAASTPAAEATPIYRRWWLWAGVGALVVVGAVVAVAVATSGTTFPNHAGDTAGFALVHF